MTPFYYLVRAWAEPDSFEELLAYLKNGHVADVAAQPGVTIARIIVLDEKSDEGWPGILTYYEFESADAFHAYMKSDAKARYEREGAPFIGKSKAERMWGNCILEVIPTQEPV